MSPEVFIILAVNKSDLELEVTQERLEQVCHDYGNMEYIYVSAKSGNNIEKLFKMSFQNHVYKQPEINTVEVSNLNKRVNSWRCSII